MLYVTYDTRKLYYLYLYIIIFCTKYIYIYIYIYNIIIMNINSAKLENPTKLFKNIL